jgi:transposase InsO family protein
LVGQVRCRHSNILPGGRSHLRSGVRALGPRSKVERYHRTLADEWAYARPYTSDTARANTLPTWLHFYNHHRGHTAIGGHPPATRVPNLSGQNT